MMALKDRKSFLRAIRTAKRVASGKRAAAACTTCKKGRTRCDDTRPCKRCRVLGLFEGCSISDSKSGSSAANSAGPICIRQVENFPEQKPEPTNDSEPSQKRKCEELIVPIPGFSDFQNTSKNSVFREEVSHFDRTGQMSAVSSFLETSSIFEPTALPRQDFMPVSFSSDGRCSFGNMTHKDQPINGPVTPVRLNFQTQLLIPAHSSELPRIQPFPFLASAPPPLLSAAEAMQQRTSLYLGHLLGLAAIGRAAGFPPSTGLPPGPAMGPR